MAGDVREVMCIERMGLPMRTSWRNSAVSSSSVASSMKAVAWCRRFRAVKDGSVRIWGILRREKTSASGLVSGVMSTIVGGAGFVGI